jgi:hypothetical protein
LWKLALVVGIEVMDESGIEIGIMVVGVETIAIGKASLVMPKNNDVSGATGFKKVHLYDFWLRGGSRTA